MPNSPVAAYPLTPPTSGSRPIAASFPPPAIPLATLLHFSSLMAVLISAVMFFQSSFFVVSTITVLGANHIAVDDVLSRSRLRPGQTLATVDPQGIVDRLTQHPWVAAANLSVSPSGHVTIAIEERVPQAALPCSMGCGRVAPPDAYVLLDATGIALASAPVPSVPTITVDKVTLPWVRIGDRIPSAAVVDALRVLAALPEQERLSGLRLRVDRLGSVTVQTTDGITLLLGLSRGLGARLAVLPQVLRAVRRQRTHVQSVDLRFVGSVIVKTRVPPPAGGVRH